MAVNQFLRLALLAGCLLGSMGAGAAQESPNRIEGLVFNDAAPDDLVGPGDSPLAGVLITLRDAAGAPLAVTVTNAAGQFQFSGLSTGTYLITETDPWDLSSVDAIPGAAATSVNLNTIRVRMMPGLTTYPGNLFLDRRLASPSTGPHALRGAVYADTNGNGRRELGERPLSGALVTLQKENGAALASRRTSHLGEFAFSGLAPGTYLLVETDPEGAISTAALPGAGGQAVGANTLRVTVPSTLLRSTGHLFLDRPRAAPSPGPAPSAGPSLRFWADRASVAPGDVLTFSFVATAGGEAPSERAALYIALPPGTELLEVANSGMAAGDTLAWNWSSFASDTAGIGAFRVRVLPGAVPGTLLETRAQLVIPARKQIVNSDRARAVVAAPGAPLPLALTADRTTARPGDVVTLTLTYANLGATALSEATLASTLPPGLAFLDADASAQVDPGTRTVRFPRGTVSPGAVGQVRFRARVELSAPDGLRLTHQAQLLAAGLSPPARSNEVMTAVQSRSAAGAYSRVTDTLHPTLVSVDSGNQFTLLSFPADRQPLLIVTQGTLQPDGSFNVIPTSGGGRVSGRIEPGSPTATVRVERDALPPYTIILSRLANADSPPPEAIGTFSGSAISPAGDWLRVRLTVEPGGCATFHADLVRFSPFQSRWRTGSYRVNSYGSMLIGTLTDGQIEAVRDTLLLKYTFSDGDGYLTSFQIPLTRQ